MECPPTMIRAAGADLAQHHAQREGEFLPVSAQVGGEMRCLILPQRPAALAQIERVEGVPARVKEIGQRLLEEVVGESVHVQYRAAAPGIGSGAPDQGRRDRPLVVRVGTEGDRRDLIAVEVPVGLPGQARGAGIGLRRGGDGSGVVRELTRSTLRCTRRSRVRLLSCGPHPGVAGSVWCMSMGKNDR